MKISLLPESLIKRYKKRGVKTEMKAGKNRKKYELCTQILQLFDPFNFESGAPHGQKPQENKP